MKFLSVLRLGEIRELDARFYNAVIALKMGHPIPSTWFVYIC